MIPRAGVGYELQPSGRFPGDNASPNLFLDAEGEQDVVYRARGPLEAVEGGASLWVEGTYVHEVLGHYQFVPENVPDEILVAQMVLAYIRDLLGTPRTHSAPGNRKPIAIPEACVKVSTDNQNTASRERAGDLLHPVPEQRIAFGDGTSG